MFLCTKDYVCRDVSYNLLEGDVSLFVNSNATAVKTYVLASPDRHSWRQPSICVRFVLSMPLHCAACSLSEAPAGRVPGPLPFASAKTS